MKNQFMKKREFLIILSVLVLAIGFWLLFMLLGSKGPYVEVQYNGETIETIDLNKDGVYHFDADYPVTLEVIDGQIRFIDSQCPDHLCEGFGLVPGAFDYAICLPARVSIFVVGEPK